MRELTFVLLVLAACSAGDDTAEGTRAPCAEGGAINICPGSARTAGEACWRMVDCGAIELVRPETYALDWDNCVAGIQGSLSPQQELIIACINATPCDVLKAETDRCFAFGAN